MISFRLLGHVSIDADGRLAYANGSKMWTVAAMLALEPNRTIPLDRLIDEVWPSRPPASAVANIRTYVSYLRRLLGPAGGRLTGHGVGYRLDLAPHELDVGEFERLVRDGRAALGRREPAACADLLRQALALFSGPALLGVRPGSALAGMVGLLEEERLGAIEDLHAVELAIGRHATLVGTLRRHVAMYPLRERGWGHLMTALYRCGNAAGALSAYGQARTMLVNQLGIEPGPHLRHLQHAVLQRAPELDLPSAGAAPAADPVESIHLGHGELFGRSAELDTITALIRARPEGPLVVGVHGPAGSGVSALVGAAGRAVADEFPNGVVYLDLAEQPRPAAPPCRGGLLILDHAANNDQIATLIATITPDVTLVAARHPITAATHHVPLGPLSPADAVDLLRAAIGDAPVGWDEVAAKEIARYCDGLPVALLAAADLARADHAGTPPSTAQATSSGLAGLAAWLAPECDRLDALDLPDRSIRHRLRRDVTQLSGTRSGGRAVEVLTELGRRDVSSASAIDAARWMGTSTAEIEALAAHLTSAALLTTDGSGHYELRPLIRIFAGELARAADDDPDARSLMVASDADRWLGRDPAQVRLLLDIGQE